MVDLGVRRLNMFKIFGLLLTPLIIINGFTNSIVKTSASLEGQITFPNPTGDLIPAKDVLIWVKIPGHSPSSKASELKR